MDKICPVKLSTGRVESRAPQLERLVPVMAPLAYRSAEILLPSALRAAGQGLGQLGLWGAISAGFSISSVATLIKYCHFSVCYGIKNVGKLFFK